MPQKTVRYEMQWDDETHRLAERAAQASGLGSIKAYVTHLVRQHAPEALDPCRSTKLTNEQFDAFLHVCDNPPPVSAKIRKAAQALDREGLAPS
ncbi:MAG: DUF1778 domain-containing protein [Pseudomonadales bacterium]